MYKGFFADEQRTGLRPKLTYVNDVRRYTAITITYHYRLAFLEDVYPGEGSVSIIIFAALCEGVCLMCVKDQP